MYKFNIPMLFPDGNMDAVGVEYVHATWNNGISPEPLDRRAWAYQEQILSRRTLTYGTSTLTWRCERDTWAWNTWLRQHQDNTTRVLFLAQSGTHPYREAWKGMVALYGRRHLTFPEDKLPAISALASEVLSLSIEGGKDPGRYLAGLWEHDLLDQLTWFACPEESREVRGIPYRAPTWSWASVDCPVIFPDPRGLLDTSELESVAGMGTELEIIDCVTTPRSDILPLGEVTGGRLRVRGCLIDGADVLKPESWLVGTFKGTDPDVVLKMDCHSIGDENAVIKAQTCWWLRVQHRHGIVLECSDGAVYRRVGCVVFRGWTTLSSERPIIDIV